MRTLRLLAAAFALGAAPALAQPTTVGSPVATNTLNGFGPLGVRVVGQTLAAASAPSFLQRFTFLLGESYNGANLRFVASVFDRTAGAAAYTSGERAGSGNVLGLTRYTFAPGNLRLEAGHDYALLLTATGVAGGDPNGAFDVVGTTEDPDGGPGDAYAGGALVLGDDVTSLTALDFDAAFRATFTPSAVVPEPGTVALLGAGLLGLAGGARRRRARA